jgi:hypothetical protein
MLQPKGREGSSMGWKEWARNEPEEDMGESRRGLRLLLLVINCSSALLLFFTFLITIFDSALNPVVRIRITSMRILLLKLMRIQILAFHKVILLD